MTQARGTVALIGSGELSGTMVETHKKLLAGISAGQNVLFLDTPAGFQENVDLISRRAVDYFKQHINQVMEVASFKAKDAAASSDAEELYNLLGRAGYVLIGPGSPTYAVRHLKDSPIPALLSAMISRGGCLVAASAAALSVGSHTIPVYEIYKVGEPVHWVGGLNILGKLGLELVIVPHWNNAEGGNHDTRYCYMGEKRFRALEAELPPGTVILGLDEHTVCTLDFKAEEAVVQGLGQVTIRIEGSEKRFARRDLISFDLLRGDQSANLQGRTVTVKSGIKADHLLQSEAMGTGPDPAFWDKMHNIEKVFHQSLAAKDATMMIKQILEADRVLWKAQLDLENPEFISQGRELFRELIVLAGTGIKELTSLIPERFDSLISALVRLRENYRRDQRWPEADQIRNILLETGVLLNDTGTGPKWEI